MAIDTAVVRQFLRDRFNDEEFDALCFDYFADVWQNFSDNMTRERKIQLLLDYCQRQGRLPDLLAALKRKRPDLYEMHFGEEGIVSRTAVPPSPPLSLWKQILVAVRLSPVKTVVLPILILLIIVLLIRTAFLPDESEIMSTPQTGVALGDEETANTDTRSPEPISEMTEQVETVVSETSNADWQGPPNLVASPIYRGPIGLNQTKQGTLSPGNFPDTWLFSEGPGLIKITLEGEAHMIGLIRVHRESEPDPDQATAELNASTRGEPIQLLFEAGAGNYIIAVRDAANEGGRYTLTVEGTAPDETSSPQLQVTETPKPTPLLTITPTATFDTATPPLTATLGITWLRPIY